jgi:predicted Rossmann-fold nucleotide-binding protein
MRIAVYLGSSAGRRPEYATAAVQTGTLIARAGLGIVYGGSSIGLMGALADAALAAGGEVTGVIPEGLFAAEVAHQGLTRL